MKIEKKIEQELSRQFGQFINPKQAKRSLLLIQGMIESKTVNLWSCAEAVGRQACMDLDSNQLYAMFLDHFQTGKYDKLLKSYFLSVFYLTFHLSDGRLVMDRTEWKIGLRWHNLLVIGYICHDCLIPLVWIDLGERKNSSTAERIALLKRLLCWWSATGVDLPPLILYADREFIGSKWFVTLVNYQIDFVIRLRKNQKFTLWRNNDFSEKQYTTDVLSRYLQMYGLSHVDIVVADQVVIPWTCSSKLVFENGRESIQNWYLAANITEPQKAHEHYLCRWSIETTFGHTKSKGLNLEDFNLEGAHKLAIMFGLVSIVYAISIRQAIEEKLINDRTTKTYSNGKKYPAKSSFKCGLEYLRKIVRNVKELYSLILHLFEQVHKRLMDKIFILNNSIVQ